MPGGVWLVLIPSGAAVCLPVIPKIKLPTMDACILLHYQGEWMTLFCFALLLALIGFVFTLCWAPFGPGNPDPAYLILHFISQRECLSDIIKT